MQDSNDNCKKEENIKTLLKKELGVEYALPKYSDEVGKKVHILVCFVLSMWYCSMIPRICRRSTQIVRCTGNRWWLVHIDENYSMYVFDGSTDSYFDFLKRENQEVRACHSIWGRTLSTKKKKERELQRAGRISTASWPILWRMKLCFFRIVLTSRQTWFPRKRLQNPNQSHSPHRR